MIDPPEREGAVWNFRFSAELRIGQSAALRAKALDVVACERIAFKNRLLRDRNQRGGLNATRKIIGILLLLFTAAYSQEITTGNTVNVPSNGEFGGQNASLWKAECGKGMVMTGH